MLTFQEIITNLQKYWINNGCLLLQPYDMEMGAATFNPFIALKTLGDRPWQTCFVQGCRRPSDGRYGKNPNRLQHYYQFQVLIKPSPSDSQELYLKSLESVNIDPKTNDIKFIEDDFVCIIGYCALINKVIWFLSNQKSAIGVIRRRCCCLFILRTDFLLSQ